MVDQKRDEINVAHGFQNFNIECNETIVSTPCFLPCYDPSRLPECKTSSVWYLSSSMLTKLGQGRELWVPGVIQSLFVVQRRVRINSSHFSGFCIETLEIIILCGHLQFFSFVLLLLPNWCFVGPVCTVVCCPQGWIHEKAKLIESTDELGNDLAGVMTLQRRLSTMERDLAAIQAKVRKWRFAAATERGGNIKCKEWRESYPVISS